jgi:hypothetical protein
MPWFSGALPIFLTLASPADAVVDDAPRAVAQPGMRATASSVLVAKKRAKDRYAAERAIDGSLSTCWCEGAADVGKGEWIQIDFDVPARIRAVRIYPGCGTTEAVYRASDRIARLTATAGDLSRSVDLPDVRKLHDLGLSTDQPVSSIRLIVEDVYPGARGQDTCIAQVEIDKE